MDSDSSQNSLGEDLDKIGRLNLSMSIPNMNLGQYLNRPTFNLPNLPNLPSFDFKNLSRVKTFSEDVSKYISQYVALYDDATTITSIKTAISTRIQMNTFLHDLDLGFSLTAAIDRLEPLTSIIHEAIILPADDYDDEDEGVVSKHANRDIAGVIAEPHGVDKIVLESNRPLVVSEIVNPEKSIASNSAARAKHKKRRHAKTKRLLLSDPESTTTQFGSDLDQIDELSMEEVKRLTEISVALDFEKEELLRGKIQNIQRLDISQRLKNKLVTKLMMGNYYRLINEELPGKVRGLKLDQRPAHNDSVAEEPESAIDTNAENDMDMDIDDQEHNQKHNHHEFHKGHEHKYQHEHEHEHHRDETDIESGTDGAVTDTDAAVGGDVILTMADLIPTYHNKELGVMGCQHYQRNCKLECPTCLKWFTCRFCHDAQVPDHKLVRASVKRILCMSCNTPQTPSDNYCIECEAELANYFCAECVLYDNDPAKDIYHCDKCGICRLGLGLGKDYFHCNTCNICLSIDLKERHKCLANTTHCNCPICNEYLFTLISKVVFMKCGHLIHQNCYNDLIKHSYKCPLCKKTVVDVETQFRILDQEILQLPLPAPYNMWRCIVGCNDCNGKSMVAYHVLGLKCEYCKSYNTNQVKLIKPEEEEEEPLDVNTDEAALRETENSMRLIGTNLESNFRIDEQNFTHTDEGYDDYDEGEESEFLGPDHGNNGLLMFMFDIRSLQRKRQRKIVPGEGGGREN